MQSEVQSPAAGPLRLQVPEVLQAIGARAVRAAVPLAPERQAEVEGEVGRFLSTLLAQELHGGGFTACLGGAFAIGRAQVSMAAGLVEAGLLQRKFSDMDAMPVFRALRALGVDLAALRPGQDARVRHWWGRLPWAARPLAEPQGAGSVALRALQVACDVMAGELSDLRATRAALWDAMQKLAASIHFAQVLDERLHVKVEVLKASDAYRAGALGRDVLLQLRQNLQEMLQQQVSCTNCFLAIEVLDQTGREVLGGCATIRALAAGTAGNAEGGAPHGEALEHALQAIAAMEAFRADVAGAMAQNAATLQALAADNSAPQSLH